MTIERITELERFIEREMKGNEALTNDSGCVARAKIDRDILSCLKELKSHREAWDRTQDRIKAWTREYADSDNLLAIGRVEAFNKSLEIIEEYRQKEGDGE